MTLLEPTGPLLLATAEVPAALLASDDDALVAGRLLPVAEEDPTREVALDADAADEERPADEPVLDVEPEVTPPVVEDVATLEVAGLLEEEDDIPVLPDVVLPELAITREDPAPPPLLLETRPPTTVVSRWQVPS